MKAEKIVSEDLKKFAAWYEDEASQYFELPTEKWLKYVTDAPNVHAWKFVDGDELVGLVQADVEEDKGYMGFIVSPTHRRKGYGLRILEYLERAPLLAGVRLFFGSVEPKNTNSIQLLLKAGYKGDVDKRDKDGMIVLSKDVSR